MRVRQQLEIRFFHRDPDFVLRSGLGQLADQTVDVSQALLPSDDFARRCVRAIARSAWGVTWADEELCTGVLEALPPGATRLDLLQETLDQLVTQWPQHGTASRRRHAALLVLSLDLAQEGDVGPTRFDDRGPHDFAAA